MTTGRTESGGGVYDVLLVVLGVVSRLTAARSWAADARLARARVEMREAEEEANAAAEAVRRLAEAAVAWKPS